MSRHILRIALVIALLALGSVVYSNVSFNGIDGADEPSPRCDAPPVDLEMKVLREIPHDPGAFTQGLAFSDEELFEGTGLEGRSEIRRIDPDNGKVLDSKALADEHFGEGLSANGDELVQITWKSGVAFRWTHDADGFTEVGTFEYDGEGWGLATDDAGDFLMSDGTDVVQYRDPDSFELLDTIRVERTGGEVGELNELEFADGRLWANQWKSDEIVRIRTDCGDAAVVDAVLDASQLTQAAQDAEGSQDMDVLNGIAHLEGNRFLLTGKRWPLMFEVEVNEPGADPGP